MKILKLIPDGWRCTFAECPPGFFTIEDHLFFKSDYYTNNYPDAFNEGGSVLSLGITKEAIQSVIVQPVKKEWEDIEL